MAYEMREGEGSIFKNDDKREGKRDPDYRGNALIGGVAYFVDSWINTSKDGTRKFMSLKFKRRDKQPSASSGEMVAPPMAAKDDPFDQDIPF
jgi:hypothetical protein